MSLTCALNELEWRRVETVLGVVQQKGQEWRHAATPSSTHRDQHQAPLSHSLSSAAIQRCHRHSHNSRSSHPSFRHCLKENFHYNYSGHMALTLLRENIMTYVENICRVQEIIRISAVNLLRINNSSRIYPSLISYFDSHILSILLVFLSYNMNYTV